MSSALAYFFCMAMLSAACVGLGIRLAVRLESSLTRGRFPPWLVTWSIKGLLFPLLLWIFMNLRLSWSFQPFMPVIQAAQNLGKPWGPAFIRVLADGLCIISSYWLCITLGWAVARVTVRLDESQAGALRSLAQACFLGMTIPAILVILVGGLPLLGLGIALVLAPLAGYAPEVLHPPQTPPLYARAVARIKFGKYSEAEWEIIRELEKCEDDFEGWMMLAELYANHFNDLAEAEQTVLEICHHPRTTVSELARALHRLADWQLKIGNDPGAARRALQTISRRLPNTHLAHMAELRSRQLPLTVSELQEQRTNSPIPLPALGDTLDDNPVSDVPTSSRSAAAREANACVESLKRDPNNVKARERLARLFAERLEQADHGIEQILLLLDVPDQTVAQRAKWLSLAAAWEIKYRQDPESGRKLLEQIVRDFPESVQAFAARRRLGLLKVQPQS